VSGTRRPLILAVGGTQPDRAPVGAERHVGPSQRRNLALPPTGQVGKRRRVGEPYGQRGPQRRERGGLEEALAGIVLGEHGYVGPVRRGELALLDGQREHVADHGELAVDRRARVTCIEPLLRVGGNPVGCEVMAHSPPKVAVSWATLRATSASERRPFRR